MHQTLGSVSAQKPQTPLAAHGSGYKTRTETGVGILPQFSVLNRKTETGNENENCETGTGTGTGTGTCCVTSRTSTSYTAALFHLAYLVLSIHVIETGRHEYNQIVRLR